jgi:hypothetical protein
LDESTRCADSSRTNAAAGGYVAHAVGGSIVTEANDRHQLRAMVRDAVLCHFDESDGAGRG